VRGGVGVENLISAGIILTSVGWHVASCWDYVVWVHVVMLERFGGFSGFERGVSFIGSLVFHSFCAIEA
jgi:hypothetical protein